METTHTPGPWTFRTDEWNGEPTDDGAGSIVAATDYIVAEVKGDVAEWQANAELIASAPALAADNETLRAQVAELVEALRRTGATLRLAGVNTIDGAAASFVRCGQAEEARAVLAKVREAQS